MTRTSTDTEVIHFEVIAPAPTVEQLLMGAYLYNSYNLRMQLVSPYSTKPDNVDDTERLAAAPFFVETGHWDDNTFVVERAVGTFRVTGTYVGAGSVLTM